MALWVLLVYLFVPSPRRVLTYLIVSFYVWAGFLKLNADWLSGAGLYGRRPLGLPHSFIPAACAYVVFLELFVVLGLLSRRNWLFWVALSQVLLFHIASFWVVGFFYPLLMFLILSIIPLSRYCPPPSTRGSEPQPGLSVLWHGLERRSTYALLGAFCFMQLTPRFFPGDPAITGQGRMFALNMFDAPTLCVATVTDRLTGMRLPPSRIQVPFLEPRISCDPIVYLQAAKNRCRANTVDRQFDDFDLTLMTRRMGSSAPVTVASISSVCTTNPHYDVFRHNPWINPAKEHGP
jgi:hypothetical protein